MALKAISELYSRLNDVQGLLKSLREMADTTRSLIKHSELPYWALEQSEDVAFAIESANESLAIAIRQMGRLMWPHDRG